MQWSSRVMLRLLIENILDRRNVFMKIKDIGRVVTGKTPLTGVNEYYGGNIMFISPSDLHGDYLIEKSEKTITEEGLKSIESNSIDGISVLTGCIGWDMGNVAMCNSRCATNQQINAIIDFNHKLVDPRYVYYWLKGKKDYLFSIASVTRTPILSKSVFENIDIPLPSLKIQERVTKLLSLIDEKIRKNHQINDYLEEMAKTIYDYWFVQFDFPDKNGKPYKSSGGTFKNGLPIGWNYVPIKNICNILSGFSFQSDDYVQNGKYKLLTIKNVQDTGINLDVDNYINILPENMPDFCKLDIGSILMSLTGNVGRVGILYDSNCLLNQRVSLMQAKNPIMTPFIYCLLKSSKMRYILESLATGTSQKNLSPIEAGNIMIPYNSEIVKNFSKKVTPLIDSIITNLKENNNLTNLREWLLPMLMNGQATIEN